MEKLRILNLFFIAFLVSLLVQYWFFPKQNTTPVLPDVYLSVEKDSIVVPNIPKITIHNTTSGSIDINPCDSISIAIDSRPLTGIQEMAPSFCAPVRVEANNTAPLSLNPLYQLFSTKPGKYILTLNSPL